MEQCFPKNDSLYDFIYLDKVRLSTLLSQLSNEGITSQLRKSITDSESNGATLGLNTLISAEKDSIRKFEEKVESSIDTSWILPMVLLNEINDKIKRNPESAQLGELILISGDMLLLDFPTLKKNLPLIKHMIKQNQGEISEGINLGFNLMEVIQDSIQLRVKGKNNNNKYWMTLDPEFFTVNRENLAIKYGSILTGDWHILGYIDLKPVDKATSDNDDFHNYFNTETESTLMHQSIMDLFVSNMDSLKAITGYNDEEFAITPIMIFKPVSNVTKKTS